MKKTTFRHSSFRISVGAAALALATSMAGVAYSGSNSHGSPAHTQSASKNAGHSGAHWSYKGATGPDSWGDLSVDYHACKTGRSQSPINIGQAEGQTVKPIRFNYRPAPLDMINNGHTIQVNYAPGSSITVGDKRYQLLQFHFHTPSEHSMHGSRSAMEVHFVHKNQAGELAVIGVMMETGDENLALRELWTHMPTSKGEKRRPANVTINAHDFLPHDKSYYRYVGSLTTPPCSEGVHWHVMRDSIAVSGSQTAKFASAIGENARPLQAMNSRLLLAPASKH